MSQSVSVAAAMAGGGGTYTWPPSDTHTWPLTGQFRQYKHGPKLFNVELSEAGVTVTGDGQQQVIKVTDLVGCVCQQKQKHQQGSSSSAFFTLLAYPLTERKKRARLALCFEVAQRNSFKENLDVANEWRKAVYHVVRTHGRRGKEDWSLSTKAPAVTPSPGLCIAYHCLYTHLALFTF